MLSGFRRLTWAPVLVAAAVLAACSSGQGAVSPTPKGKSPKSSSSSQATSSPTTTALSFGRLDLAINEAGPRLVGNLNMITARIAGEFAGTVDNYLAAMVTDHVTELAFAAQFAKLESPNVQQLCPHVHVLDSSEEFITDYLREWEPFNPLDARVTQVGADWESVLAGSTDFVPLCGGVDPVMCSAEIAGISWIYSQTSKLLRSDGYGVYLERLQPLFDNIFKNARFMKYEGCVPRSPSSPRPCAKSLDLVYIPPVVVDELRADRILTRYFADIQLSQAALTALSCR
jgi:hypothetical protein